MKLDHDRLQKYLDEIAAETIDVEGLLHQEPRKPIDIVGNPTVLKSLKYSTIVIAEAIASVLQHILAKKHNTVIDGYTSVFTKSKEHKVISTELNEFDLCLPRPLTPCVADCCERGGRVRADPRPIETKIKSIPIYSSHDPIHSKRYMQEALNAMKIAE